MRYLSYVPFKPRRQIELITAPSGSVGSLSVRTPGACAGAAPMALSAQLGPP